VRVPARRLLAMGDGRRAAGRAESNVVGPKKPGALPDAAVTSADFLTVIPQSPSLVLATYRPEYEGAWLGCTVLKPSPSRR